MNRTTAQPLFVLLVVVILCLAAAAPLVAQSGPTPPAEQPAAESSNQPGATANTAGKDAGATEKTAGAPPKGGANNPTASGSGSGASSSAQTEPTGQARGFLLGVRLEGSTSADGQVMSFSPSTGYNFNRWFGVDLGVPFYFVRSASTISQTNPSGVTGRGVGDFYFDGRISFETPLVNYGFTATGTAPTGDQGKGQSTGKFTYSLDNNFSREMWRFTPFVDVAVGNSLFSNQYLQRPYITYGHIAHFEAGTQFAIWKSLSFSASLYDDLPWGGQTVISRVVRVKGATGSPSTGPARPFEVQHITIGGPEVARDNGYTLGLSENPLPFLELSLGFNHSVHHALDTVTFGLGLNLSGLFARPSRVR